VSITEFMRLRVALIFLLPFISGCFESTSRPQRQQVSLPTKLDIDSLHDFVILGPATFTMGVPCGDDLLVFDSLASPCPPVEVSVGRFAIAKYEVTAQDFCDFLNSIPYAEAQTYVDTSRPRFTVVYEKGEFQLRVSDFALAPANGVTLHGAIAYCNYVSERTGIPHRLPTEAEWEFAARGSGGRTYPWGEESPIQRAYLSSHSTHYWGQITPMFKREWGGATPTVYLIGQFPNGSTPEGIHDLIGNTFEWTSTEYFTYDALESGSEVPGSVRALEDIKPRGKYILRGGQYPTRYGNATGWTRRVASNPTWSMDHGIRLVRDVDAE